MLHPRTRPALTAAILIAVTVTAVGAQKEFSSRNRQVGRAAVEYRDADIHVVAAYYYSQRNHDARWLMIEAAMSATDVGTIRRDAILLRRPDGREVPLASQRRVGEDVKRIEQLLQNASTVSHNVASYFTQRQRVEPMQLFRLPFGAVVHDSFVVDDHRVARGVLFFESPTGAWERGVHTLVVRHAKGAAELPIDLE